MKWVKRVKLKGEEKHSFETIDSDFSGSDHDGYYDVLNRTETDTEGSISYRCRITFNSNGYKQKKPSNSIIKVSGIYKQLITVAWLL